MTNLEFITTCLLPYFYLYLVLVLLSCIIFCPIARQHVNSIIDPMFLCIVAVISSDVIPVFLYIIGNCKGRDLVYFIFAEVIFWFTFSLSSRKRYQFVTCEFKNESVILK